MKKRLLSMLLVACMLLTLLPFAAFADGGADYGIPAESQLTDYSGKTVILHTNDVHGAVAGYANVAALKAYYSSLGANVVLVDAGDYSQGTCYVSTSKGVDAIAMMNKTGYDIATLGNHEFDYGWDQLKDNLSVADFKVICADVFDADGNTIYDPYTIIEKNGVKIGFFGMETPEAQTKVNPALIKGLTFLAGEEMFACAQAQVDALKAAGADVIIGLCHLGIDDESVGNRSTDMLAKISGVDMIIDGHSHTVISKGIMSTADGDVVVPDSEKLQSTGTAVANIGVIVIDEASKAIEDNYLVAVDGDFEKDATVAAAAKAIIDRVDAEYGQVFAKSEVALNGAKAPNGNRDSETNLGDLITDSMVWQVMQNKDGLTVPDENVVAITNGGGIRAPISVGDVTKKDVNTVLPFGNTIAVVYVTGAELLEALEASTYCTPGAVGGFPQVSGIDFTLDASKQYYANAETYPASTYYGPASIQRVTINSINGKDFDPTATYAVVTNNFCAAGGDTYYAFAAASAQFDTGIPLDEALMAYITEKLGGVIGQQYAAPQGRITLVAHNYEKGKCTICGEKDPAYNVSAPTVKITTASGHPKLTWNAVDGATKYWIYRSTDGKNFKYYDMTTKTSYTNTSTTIGTKYYYQVKAVKVIDGQNVVSNLSNAVEIMCAPAALTVSISRSNGKPKLSWSKVTGATKYWIYRSTDGGKTYKYYDCTTKTSYTNTGASSGTTYYYKVKAVAVVNGNNVTSAYSSAKSLFTSLATPSVSITTSNGKPKLTWKAVTGVDKYYIYRSTDGKNFSYYDSTTKTSYTNTSAKKGTKYYYKVKAVCTSNSNANSAQSKAVSIKATK